MAAAIAIADADGLAAVSMRAVAARLETGAASSTATSRPVTTCST